MTSLLTKKTKAFCAIQKNKKLHHSLSAYQNAAMKLLFICFLILCEKRCFPTDQINDNNVLRPAARSLPFLLFYIRISLS